MSYATFLRARQQRERATADAPQLLSADHRPAPRPWLSQLPPDGGHTSTPAAPRASSTGGMRPPGHSQHGPPANLPEQQRYLIEPEPEPEPQPRQSHTSVLHQLVPNDGNSPVRRRADAAAVLDSSIMQRSPLANVEIGLTQRRAEARRRAEVVVANANIADQIAARISADRERLGVAADREQLGLAAAAAAPAGQLGRAVAQGPPTGKGGGLSSRGSSALPFAAPDERRRLVSPQRETQRETQREAQRETQRETQHGEHDANGPAAVNPAGMSAPPHSLMDNEDQAGQLARQHLSLGVLAPAGRAINSTKAAADRPVSRSSLTPMQRAAAAVPSPYKCCSRDAYMHAA